MSKKIVTFGEIMLRLTTPDNLRIQQSRDFLVNYGGSEANVAISIANFGGRGRIYDPIAGQCTGRDLYRRTPFSQYRN